MKAQILVGDVRTRLAEIPSASVQTCVTSPPYFGLRDYGHDDQIGLESTPDEYVKGIVNVMAEVWRVLATDGTLWLNLGDSYSDSGKGGQSDAKRSEGWQPEYANKGETYGLAPKNLLGIPWRVAFALQDDGWYLRQDIIWAKPNPMPESVKDRCTKSHEYLFLLSKNPRYYFDADAIKEPALVTSAERALRGSSETMKSAYGVPGQSPHGLNKPRERVTLSGGERPDLMLSRNKRDVWTISTTPFKGAHFAVMPEALVEPCVLAGSREGDTVLDPFAGSGTVGVVALRHQRDFVGVELNPDYAQMAVNRIHDDAPMLNETATL